ncbi:MAG: GNAT family N-acetyltransferase [Oscillospiraceae bacterium]
MILETKRLILRPWRESDAEDLYEFAKDPRVGPAAGWPVHTSVDDSRRIIREVLSADETYAIVQKGEGKAIGSIGLMIGEKSNLAIGRDEAEIGYWIGVPYWGRGLVPEAVKALMKYAFEKAGIRKLWCGYFDGNDKSKRVQEKCGFRYCQTKSNIVWPLMHDIRTEHITCVTKDQWPE